MGSGSPLSAEAWHHQVLSLEVQLTPHSYNLPPPFKAGSPPRSLFCGPRPPAPGAYDPGLGTGVDEEMANETNVGENLAGGPSSPAPGLPLGCHATM